VDLKLQVNLPEAEVQAGQNRQASLQADPKQQARAAVVQNQPASLQADPKQQARVAVVQNQPLSPVVVQRQPANQLQDHGEALNQQASVVVQVKLHLAEAASLQPLNLLKEQVKLHLKAAAKKAQVNQAPGQDVDNWFYNRLWNPPCTGGFFFSRNRYYLY
jgi:hypothetical protein